MIPNAVSPTGFKYRAAAASVMRKMVTKTGVNNLTIKPVPTDGKILYYVVRKDGTGLPRESVETPEELTPPKKSWFGSVISSILRMFR